MLIPSPPRSPPEPPARPLVRFQGFALAEFYCPPGDPRWTCENRIGPWHLFVFPGTSVGITHEGGRLIVVNPNHVVFYNAGQLYRRTLIGERGDRCFFVGIDSRLAADLLGDLQPSLADRPDRPFVIGHGPSDPRSYLSSRLLFDYLSTDPAPDVLYAQEKLLATLHELAARAHRMAGYQPAPRRAPTQRAHEDAVEAVKVLLSRRFRDPMTLEALAGEVDLSPFHLARVFKRHTGHSLHAYRNQLRLRLSLERICAASTDLTDLALDLGYGSHSHFTDAFRRAFGVPPSAVRRRAGGRRLRELSKILEA